MPASISHATIAWLRPTPEGNRVWEFVNFNMTKKREPIVIVRMRRYEGLSYEAVLERVASGRREMLD